MTYEPIIGLEVHAELKTKTKMFCYSLNDPNEKHPNINICPICTGHPGTLPVINKEAVEKVILAGLALNGEIAEFSQFDRKNYFYPDLPKGYQISQYQHPLVKGGYMDIEIPNKSQIQNSKLQTRRIRIRRIHLEEDTGRLIHDRDTGSSLVDFNRAGVPLMELVTEPDFRSGEEVKWFGEELRRIFRYLEVSDADMEKGELRIEVNISLRPNEMRIQPNNERIVLKEDSYRLMGLLFEVQNKLGSVYKEKNYKDAIEEVLQREKIPYEREKRVRVKLDGKEISDFFIDFLVNNQIVLEVKATKFITQEDIRQTLRYLKEVGAPLGIIVNFRTSKLEYKRLINPQFGKNSFGLDKNSGEFSLGTKVEIKNINSFKFAAEAVEYEIKRQSELLDHGEKVILETRGWNEFKQATFSQRSKEEAHDYRYFPEPDLPPLKISREYVEGIRAKLPELPAAKRERFGREYGLEPGQIEIFVRDKMLANYFEKVASELKQHDKETSERAGRDLTKTAASFLTGDFLRLLSESSAEAHDTRITPENFAELILYAAEDKISNLAAKQVLEEMFRSGQDPSEIIERLALWQLSDTADLEDMARHIVKENQKVVEEYKKGKTASLQYLVGQVMKESRGKANPKMVQEILKKELEK